MAKSKIKAEEMTDSELTAEIARLTSRIGALKTLRQMRIAMTQTRESAHRRLIRYHAELKSALETIQATEAAEPGEGRAAA